MASACFPDEVFELILEYLPRKRLVSLIELSPTIDRIVFSSNRLKTKILRRWNNFSYKPNLTWNENTIIKKFPPLKKTKNFEELTFSLGCMEDKKFHKLLRKHSRSLRRLVFNGLTFENTAYFRKSRMPILEEIYLERMMKDDVLYVLSLISAPKLRVFHYKNNSSIHCRETIENDAQTIINFIASMKELKSLKLPWYCTEALVNYSTNKAPVEFRLECLELVSGWSLSTDDEEFCKRFDQFLVSQSDLLQELDLQRFYLNEKNIDQILRMKQLKTFGSRYCAVDFENLANITNFSIENMSIACSEGDLQTETSICKVLSCCQSITKVAINAQVVTAGMSTIFKNKKLLGFQDVDRIKIAQLLKLFNKTKTVKIRWLSCTSLTRPDFPDIQRTTKTLDSVLELRFRGLEIRGKAILFEKITQSKGSFFKSKAPGDDKMVFAVKSTSYFSAEMMIAGLQHNREVSDLKLMFIKDAFERPIFILHTKKDSSSISDFFNTHHRVYGFYSLTWEKMRRLNDPAKRCFDCLKWGLLFNNCPFQAKCYKQDDYNRSKDSENPWSSIKLLTNATYEKNKSFETDFPQYNHRIKQIMRLVYNKKALTMPDKGWDAVMRGMVDFLRYAVIVRENF